MYDLPLPIDIENKAIKSLIIFNLMIILCGYEIYGIFPLEEYGLKYVPYLLVAPLFGTNINWSNVSC